MCHHFWDQSSTCVVIFSKRVILALSKPGRNWSIGIFLSAFAQNMASSKSLKMYASDRATAASFMCCFNLMTMECMMLRLYHYRLISILGKFYRLEEPLKAAQPTFYLLVQVQQKTYSILCMISFVRLSLWRLLFFLLCCYENNPESNRKC